MHSRGKRVLVAFAASAVAVSVAGCAGSSGSSSTGSGASGQTVIWGTTDKPVSFDPAGAYDLPSWNVIYNVYQTLLRVDPQTEKNVPDAASGCKSNKDFTVWTCTLRSGQEFSNGDPLTSADVKFSFDRVEKINDPSGPSSLLADVKTAAPDPQTVVFTLKSGNSLWPYILSTAAGAIVDHKVFPATKELADDKIVGSGPYQLQTYQTNQLAQFTPNPNYGGDLQLANGGLVIRYYADENSLKIDLQQGKVDVAYRSLSPTSISQLAKDSSLNVETAAGGEIRYLVFNENTMPGSNPAQKLAIRQAVAYLINRQSISKNVYNGTVQPLYSMVPKGLPGEQDVYSTTYGATPDKAKAQQVLQKAGLKTPVNLQIWYTPSHYGPLSGDEYTEIKRELEASGLFKVDLQSTEWDQYSANCLADKCPIYQLGWFPDYPDTDDYVGPFFGSSSFLNDHYSNAKVDALLKDEEGTTDQAKRIADFQKIQQLTVKAAPVIPYWQAKQVAVTHGTLNGIQDTLTPDYIFRFWVLSKS